MSKNLAIVLGVVIAGILLYAVVSFIIVKKAVFPFTSEGYEWSVETACRSKGDCAVRKTDAVYKMV